jgi:hypothetical protein
MEVLTTNLLFGKLDLWMGNGVTFVLTLCTVVFPVFFPF